MEPSLENISDYNTLSGEKKRVVWAVVVAGLVLGGIYSVASMIYDNPQGSIQTTETIHKIPIR